ncbi:MAG: Stp1/IreP family PP2C-type Ser/Thr phosphatase [Clostridia bacterium]|nr:Stp1/IreP family PP2C-type Ser/Thr phosphatase [Clostridia bacterium]
MIEYAALTNKGKVRDMNQDCYYASTDVKPLFILCDGMGGHAAGDIASRSTVESVSRYINMHVPFDLDDKKAKSLLEGAVKFANKLVFARSKTDMAFDGMGTTCDVCMADFDIMYICHVGDSRVYLLRDTEIKPITRDHTLIEELIDNGTITREEAENHPNKHMITRAVGTEKTIKCDFLVHEMQDGDMFLMCSDGLSNMLTDVQIKDACLVGGDLKKTVKMLVDRANENGGLDNITAILIKYSKDKEE